MTPTALQAIGERVAPIIACLQCYRVGGARNYVDPGDSYSDFDWDEAHCSELMKMRGGTQFDKSEFKLTPKGLDLVREVIAAGEQVL